MKALFDIRDGNNSENFRGAITGVTAGTIRISNPSITNVNAMTMPAEGVLTIDGKNYNYTDFTFTTDADGNVKEYTFTLENQLSSDQQAKLDGKQASIGESIDAMGIPYYLAQMNEFLRNFAISFNEIMNGDNAQDLNGKQTNYFLSLQVHIPRQEKSIISAKRLVIIMRKQVTVTISLPVEMYVFPILRSKIRQPLQQPRRLPMVQTHMIW